MHGRTVGGPRARLCVQPGDGGRTRRPVLLRRSAPRGAAGQAHSRPDRPRRADPGRALAGIHRESDRARSADDGPAPGRAAVLQRTPAPAGRERRGGAQRQPALPRGARPGAGALAARRHLRRPARRPRIGHHTGPSQGDRRSPDSPRRRQHRGDRARRSRRRRDGAWLEAAALAGGFRLRASGRGKGADRRWYATDMFRLRPDALGHDKAVIAAPTLAHPRGAASRWSRVSGTW